LKNVGIILSALFRQNFRADKSTQRKKSIKALLIVAIVICAITIVPMMIVSLFSYSEIVVANGVEREYLSALFFAIEVFTIMFGTIVLMNTMFFSKDNEFLSTLPVKSGEVFTAKLLYVALNELILSGSLGLVAVIILGIVGGFSPLYYLLGLIAVVLCPLLSLTISSILLFPLMTVVSKIKKNTTLTTIISMLAFIAFFVVYVLFITKLEQSSLMGDEFVNANVAVALFKALGTNSALFFNYALAGVVFLEDFLLSLFTVVAIWGGGLVIAYLLAQAVYSKCANMQMEHSDTKLKNEGYVLKDVIQSLVIRDFKEILRDPAIFFNCIMQVIMPPLMVGLMLGVMYNEMGLLEGEMGVIMSQVMGMWMSIMFVCGSNYSASTAITRENRRWYAMKTMPVPYTMQIKAKLIIAFCFALASSVLTGIALYFFSTSILETILKVIVMIVLSYGFACLQIKLDLDKPTLNWATVKEGFKNNPATSISLFIAMAVGIVVAIVCATAAALIYNEIFNEIVVLLIAYGGIILVAAIFALLSHRSLLKNAEKLFNKLEG